jgi:Flp pilus assembly protein TadG
MHGRPVIRSAGDRRRRLSTNESGVVAIEFALTLPLILLVLFAIIEFGQVFNNLNDVNQIAAAGARFAAVDNKPTSDSLQVYLEKQADLKYLRDHIDVCIKFPVDNTPQVGEPVQVNVSAPYHLVPLLGGATINLKGSATMRMERTPTKYSADLVCP